MSTVKTCYGYAKEENACGEFDCLLNECRNSEGAHYFRVEREVVGSMMQPHAFSRDSFSVRIDRILIPLQPALQEGWRWGCIGVEIKNSGVKLGKAVCQALDYRRSVFRFNSGFVTALDQVFIWPVENVIGDIASVMMQNRIGIAHFERPDFIDLEFEFNGTIALRMREGLEFNAAVLDSAGRKVGSR